MRIRHKWRCQATDSSEDIGLVTARVWAKAGCRVFGTSRKLTAHTRDDTMRICGVSDEVRIGVVLGHPGVARRSLEDNSAGAGQPLPVHASEWVRSENFMRKWGDEGDLQQDIVDLLVKALTDKGRGYTTSQTSGYDRSAPFAVGRHRHGPRPSAYRPDVHAISMFMNIGKSAVHAPPPTAGFCPSKKACRDRLDCKVGT